ncbi:uncharacterized protein BDW70DRAFT_126669 [Aspergillus foveolatus]|uniref:uncharacterized protein n=1 Tax=Aspergillus foveolatus TaxID=210207 RepID=UPI003CCCCA3B
MSSTADLEPIGAVTLVVHPPVSSAVWTADESISYHYQLNAKCQDFITRYLGQSLLNAVPDEFNNMKCVNRKLLELAFTYPFLMHASLAVAFTYDRYLNGPFGCHRGLDECYHWTRATTLFNRRLAQPISATSRNKDAIWGTAAALAILSFASPDARTPEESWPLRHSADHSDLDWLCMSSGKMALWDSVNPLRPDSLFRVMAATFAQINAPLPERGIDGIPGSLAGVCRLDSATTAQDNPYFEAAHAVSAILNIPDSKVTTGKTQLFTRCIQGPFEDLLRCRDPVALLLLYLWYGKASCIWWIELRARVERPAICEYLRRFHRGDAAVQSSLS